MKRLRSLVAASVALGALGLFLTVSVAWAEFGIVPGSFLGKTHEPVPLLVGPPGDELGDELVSPPFKKALVESNLRRADKATLFETPTVTQAGAHPDATAIAELEDAGGVDGSIKDIVVKTPPGFLASLTAVPPCDRETFRNSFEGQTPQDACPPASQVGVITIKTSLYATQARPVYRLTARSGVTASFGFPYTVFGVVLDANVRTDEDYGVRVDARSISNAATFRWSVFTFWGTPGDPIHDPERWNPITQSWGVGFGIKPVSFIQAPANCSEGPLPVTTRFSSWGEPDNFLPANPFDPDYTFVTPEPTGCENLSFDPAIDLIPSAKNSDSPTGVSVRMDVPQSLEPKDLATPPLRKAVVTLPEGMSVNPSAADGIEGCSEAQIGLLGTGFQMPNPIRFATGDSSCPQASKVGTGILHTPLLEEPVPGDVYLAEPHANPFDSLLALYLVFRGPGFVAKIPGVVEPDPVTGQLVSTFDNSPQAPFSRLDLNFFGGPRAPLATSPACGVQAIETELTPWSAPQSGPPATPANEYLAAAGPGGTGCSSSFASRPFSPELTAGTGSPIAGGFSPLTMRLTRPDGHQELARLTVKPPLGFTGILKGVPYCSEGRLAAAESRSGESEAAFPSCPDASKLGSVLTGAGAGPTPLFTKGSAYLAGPYKGAPLSLAIVTPAIAGGTPGDPVFDLGTVVVRVALHVDPKTAQITAVSDPVPQTLEGVPLRIRDIRVVMDRPRWGINPTSCAEKSFQVEAIGQSGAAISLTNRFQVAECANMRFKPRLSLRLRGSTKRTGNPSLRAVLLPRRVDANISRAAVTLPRTAFLDNEHIRTVCTRVQFAANNCPGGAIYGRAQAFTPLLDRPLEGPVYLRSSDNLLPDLVADLRGPDHQPIRIELVGRVDSVNGGIRNTFSATPDAQVEKFVLTMQGGNKGLIINSDNLCGQTSRATVKLRAHNGRRYDFRPKVIPVGCKK